MEQIAHRVLIRPRNRRTDEAPEHDERGKSFVSTGISL
jgi:hypothetical protein